MTHVVDLRSLWARFMIDSNMRELLSLNLTRSREKSCKIPRYSRSNNVLIYNVKNNVYELAISKTIASCTI